jgi:glycosyltransferase involved in cell wall biosynthesis
LDQRPLVSVLVPVYQGERYLADALDSIFAQGYEPLEVIVVDDGSTDRSAEIARSYPVRYLRQENAGIAAARNAAIDAAEGEIVAFLDADDVWLPGGLEKRVSHLLSHPDVSYVVSRMEVFLEAGNDRPPWIQQDFLDEPQNGLLQTFVARRDVFDRVGPFDTQFAISEDMDWFARAKDRGVRCDMLDEVCARYRLHGESTTHRQGGSVMPTLLRALRGSIARRRDAPRVSVIIPVYNGERYLTQAIESVLAQTSPPFEVIVVDDGSTDGSASVAERYAPRVKVHSQPNAGIGATRNRGVALAQGELIAFLDADDLWSPRKLELQLAALARDPAPDFVLGHVEQFIQPGLDPVAAARIDCPSGLQPGYLPGAALIRREALDRVGPFREDLRVGEFVDWMARAREIGLREAMLPEHVLSRRLHDTNQSLKERSDMTDFVRVVKASLDRRRAAAAAAAEDAA